MNNKDQFFSEDYLRRREQGRRYALERVKVRNKRIVKGLSIAAIISVMAGGIVKYIPSMFKEAKAVSKDISYTTTVDNKNDVNTNNKEIINYNHESETNVDEVLVEDDSVDEEIDNLDQDDNTEAIFTVGNDASDMVEDFINSDIGSYLYQFSSDYGVDPYIMAAICMTETSLEHDRCCPGGDRYSGYGVGYMQLESPSGEEITAYNYNTGEYDTDYVTMENACNPVTNIKIGCMIMQNSIKNNMGNLFLSVQAHNFGQGMVDSVLYYNYGDVDAIKKDYANLSWVSCMEDAHLNPTKYYSDWSFDTYGGSEYIACVFSHCPVGTASYRYNNSNITVDLASGKVLGNTEIESKTR